MKTAILFTFVSLANSLAAQEAKRLQANDFLNLSVRPVAEAPPKGKFIPKGPRREVGRTYNPKSARVAINFSDGSKVEQPYVEIPLFFRVGTADLLDANSRANVRAVADGVQKVLSRDPDASFRIEGHASVEGNEQENQRLSEDRSRAIRNSLVAEFQISDKHLNDRGFGGRHALVRDPKAGDSLLQADRRVLVVREK